MQPKYPTIPGLTLLHQGKVRDTYATDDPDLLLVVASDRVSTHEVVHESLVPRKGEVLTATTIAWLTGPLSDIPNHLVAYGQEIFDFLPSGIAYPADLHLRGIIIERCDVPPVEFIERRRLGGSFWKKFYSKGFPNPYGISLPPDLPLMHLFDEAIFTPTEKNDTTNDPPLDAKETEQRYPDHVALMHEAYAIAFAYAQEHGIDIVDTKLEIGADSSGKVRIVDELFTGDSSRFAYTEDIILGQEPPWADKQIVRDEAERIWNGEPKVPLEFSADILKAATDAYLRVFQTLFGITLDEFQEIELS